MILVTGGTGLVGGHLLWHLLQKNDKIIAIRRTTSNIKPLETIFRFYTSKPNDFLSRIEWINADILDLDALNNAMKTITEVYHCAAIVSFGANFNNLYDTNVIGTRNIVRAALSNNVRKFCFVSSIAACGNSLDEKCIDEKCVWTETPKSSLYSISKYYSEQEVWKGISEGLNAVIVNPGVILGVSGTSNGSSQLFSQVKKGMIFYTNGGSGYIDVQDVVKSMIQLMTKENYCERYILVSENCSNKDVLSWMADGFGKTRPFIPIGKRILWLFGVLSEISGVLFHIKPLIDRETARSATNRKYYSNEKIKSTINSNFKSVKDCIIEVCEFEKKSLLTD